MLSFFKQLGRADGQLQFVYLAQQVLVERQFVPALLFDSRLRLFKVDEKVVAGPEECRQRERVLRPDGSVVTISSDNLS